MYVYTWKSAECLESSLIFILIEDRSSPKKAKAYNGNLYCVTSDKITHEVEVMTRHCEQLIKLYRIVASNLSDMPRIMSVSSVGAHKQ